MNTEHYELFNGAMGCAVLRGPLVGTPGKDF